MATGDQQTSELAGRVGELFLGIAGLRGAIREIVGFCFSGLGRASELEKSFQDLAAMEEVKRRVGVQPIFIGHFQIVVSIVGRDRTRSFRSNVSKRKTYAAHQQPLMCPAIGTI